MSICDKLQRVLLFVFVDSLNLSFFVFLFYFIYFWLCREFVAVQAFSGCSKQGLLSSLLVLAFLVVEHRP